MNSNIAPTGSDWIDGIDNNYVMVLNDADLHALCAQWKNCQYLAMDTEFIRTTTFFPQVGLVQVNAGKGNYLIDPLEIADWGAFCELMVDPEITKVFHSCSEDLQVFMAVMQLVPSPVFDTQIAASLLNLGFGCSYQNLVRHYLEIDLPKGETRSDWLQRPLYDRQLNYAALDVACLPSIYLAQQASLSEAGRLTWLEEECRTLIDQYQRELEGDFSGMFLGLKGAWQLSQRQLGVLKKLAEWRELRARKRDKPRNWIIKEKQLIDIARLCPADIGELRCIDDLGKNFIRHEGNEVIDLVQQALTMDEEMLPDPIPDPLDGGAKNRLKRAQQFAHNRAEELELPTEMLIRKRWLITLMQNLRDSASASEDDLLPGELKGWRYDQLMPGLVEAIKK